MKILYLITKSNFGGAQKYVHELAVLSKESGHEVAVAAGGTGLAGAARGDLFIRLEEADIPTYFINSFVRDMSPTRDLRALLEIWKLLRKIKPDVLHVTSSKAGGLGALAGRLFGTPRIIFTSHGLTVDETWRPLWQRVLIYIGTWVTLRLAHHNIMISTETFNRARRMFDMRNRVSLIHNGIKPIEFVEKGAARAKLAPSLPPNAFVIGGIGELHPNKNWQSVIAALTRLPTSVHLVIIGEGEDRPQLERLIAHHHLSKRVHLPGQIKEASRLIKAFDVFTLPSKKEGLPYVLLEAGLAALPTIASDLPGNADIIESGQSGLLISPTPNLIATSISMLMRDQSMGRKLGQALQNKVTISFSMTKMYQETQACYQPKISVA